MDLNRKRIVLLVIYIGLGIIMGATIFIPIFEDTFMGIFMGLLIAVGIWSSTDERK